VGPVIDEAAYRRILDYIEIGKSEATLAYQAKEVPPRGYFIPPTIFTDVKPTMRIAREEIFGPVLSILKVRDLDEALEVANGTDLPRKRRQSIATNSSGRRNVEPRLTLITRIIPSTDLQAGPVALLVHRTSFAQQLYYGNDHVEHRPRGGQDNQRKHGHLPGP